MDNQIKLEDGTNAYVLDKNIYLTRDGRVFKVTKKGIKPKGKVWNSFNFQIRVDKIRNFASQMLRVFKPELYKKYESLDFFVEYKDGNKKNCHIDNLTVRPIKSKILKNKKLIKEAEAELGIKKELNKENTLTKNQIRRIKERDKIKQLAKHKAYMAKKRLLDLEYQQNNPFHIFVNPKGYYSIRVLIQNELKVVASHNKLGVIESFGQWSKQAKDIDIIKEGDRLTKKMEMEYPVIYCHTI